MFKALQFGYMSVPASVCLEGRWVGCASVLFL